MAHANTELSDKIVAAFGRSRQFPEGSSEFKIFSLFIARLGEVVGADRLAEKFSLVGYSRAASCYLLWLSDNEDFLAELGPVEAMITSARYRGFARSLDVGAENPEARLVEIGVSTEAELMELPAFGLAETAKAQYREGTLTLADVLISSPEMFIPEVF